MHESMFQQILWYIIHGMMFLYYGPKVIKQAKPYVDKIWTLAQIPFEIFIPKSNSISRPLLSKSLSYLLQHERIPIIMTALGLNALGMALSLAFPTLLYLDMVGTAVAAILLGPWYGAIVACISSAIVNYALFPAVDCLPWIMVNVSGALFWGALASMPWFRNSDDGSGPTTRLQTIVLGGVLASFVLACPGTITQAGLGTAYEDSLSFNREIGSALKELSTHLATWLDQHFLFLRTQEFGINGTSVAKYLSNAIRYIPDKVITILVALLIIRTIFPLYWDLLVKSRPEQARVLALPRQPLLFIVVYIAVMAVHHLFTLEKRSGATSSHTPLYAAMYVLVLVGALVSWFIAETGDAVGKAEAEGVCVRAKIYEMHEARATATVWDRFDNGGVLGVLLVVLLFSLLVLLLISFTSSPDPTYAPAGIAFRGMSVLVVGIVFLLKMAQSAAHQQMVLDSLPELKAEALKMIREGELED